MTTPWTRDWPLRMREKLTALGFETVEAFISASEGRTFEQLARDLGPDVAAVQVEMAYLRECRHSGRMLRAAAECLARTVIERFPRGWGVGVRVEYRTVGTMVDWVADMLLDVEQSELDEAHLKSIAAALTDIVQPPKGWLPKNGDDALIQRAFQVGLGQVNE